MSRSRKKHFYFKVGDNSWKKIYNRKLRRTMSNEDLPQYGRYRKKNNSYDIIDYRSDCSWKEFKKWGWNWQERRPFKDEQERWAGWKRSFGTK